MKVATTPPHTDGAHVLFIPCWRPARVNELLGHWAKAAHLKAADREMVCAYARKSNIPPASGPREVSLYIVFGKGERRGDDDAYWKSTLDACVHAKLLIDDSPRWCRIGSVEQVRGPQTDTFIILKEAGASRE